jgi:hypothetical protein
MSRSYTSSPPSVFMVCSGTAKKIGSHWPTQKHKLKAYKPWPNTQTNDIILSFLNLLYKFYHYEHMAIVKTVLLIPILCKGKMSKKNMKLQQQKPDK